MYNSKTRLALRLFFIVAFLTLTNTVLAAGSSTISPSNSPVLSGRLSTPDLIEWDFVNGKITDEQRFQPKETYDGN